MWKNACKCCVFHLINYSQNVGNLWLEFAFLHLFSWTICKKNCKYQYQDQKNLNDCSIHTYTFHGKTKTNIRNTKFSNFKMKMRPKIKIFLCKFNPFNIDIYFKHWNTSCTLLKIVYILSKFEKLGFKKINIINHNFIFICMVKEKTMEIWFGFLNMYNEF